MAWGSTSSTACGSWTLTARSIGNHALPRRRRRRRRSGSRSGGAYNRLLRSAGAPPEDEGELPEQAPDAPIPEKKWGPRQTWRSPPIWRSECRPQSHRRSWRDSRPPGAHPGGRQHGEVAQVTRIGGRVAVVTGASSGIGKAVAIELAQRG